MKAPGRVDLDDCRHEVALGRQLAHQLRGDGWIEIEDYSGALDLADELIEEIERLHALLAVAEGVTS